MGTHRDHNLSQKFTKRFLNFSDHSSHRRVSASPIDMTVGDMTDICRLVLKLEKFILFFIARENGVDPRAGTSREIRHSARR
jgi:hypothetical protein